jgi:tetratricopeptide (TPR) repeat protein
MTGDGGNAPDRVGLPGAGVPRTARAGALHGGPAGPSLALVQTVDRAVRATASELFEARQYPGVIALVDEALETEPESVPLLLLRARARFALRRDVLAQADLRDIIRLDPQCASAYRLLGELAARRDEHDSAAIFFREALRLAPGDPDILDWLAIVGAAAPVEARVEARVEVERVARGTDPPEPVVELGEDDIENEAAETLLARGSNRVLGDRPPVSRERPGFADYLVTTGILTRERLRAALAYQRSMRVELSTAIVTLGLASPQRIEWAAVAHQSDPARPR